MYGPERSFAGRTPWLHRARRLYYLHTSQSFTDISLDRALSTYAEIRGYNEIQRFVRGNELQSNGSRARFDRSMSGSEAGPQEIVKRTQESAHPIVPLRHRLPSSANDPLANRCAYIQPCVQPWPSAASAVSFKESGLVTLSVGPVHT